MRTHYTSIHSTHTWTKVQIAWYLFFCRQKKIDFYWTFKVSTIHNAFFLNRSSFIQKPIQKIRLISAGSTIQFQFHFCVCLYLFLWWCSFSHSLSLSLERRKKERKKIWHTFFPFFSSFFWFRILDGFFSPATFSIKIVNSNMCDHRSLSHSHALKKSNKWIDLFAFMDIINMRVSVYAGAGLLYLTTWVCWS